METADAIWMCLPEGMDELFEIVKFERTDKAYDIWLDEKKKLSDEDYRNPNIVARGYTDYVTVQDYPILGRPVYQHMRKNKWWDKAVNEIFSCNLELPSEEGTRLSAEFVVFFKMKVETTALSIKHIAQMYCVNGKYFADLYRNKISGYVDWCQDGLGGGFYFNAANIGPYMSLDETCLSNDEVWTFLTNKDGHRGKGTLAAAIPETKSDGIISILTGAMGKSVRRMVREVTCDLSPSMMPIAAEVFCNAHVVNDRFNVQQVYNEAVDEIRIDIRWQLIAEENSRDKSVPPVTYSNGETMRQILARSKHTLMMPQNKWTDIQRHRVNILFRHHTILRSAYVLAMELRRIFNAKISPTKAMGRMNKWYELY